jgi:hypothetical protein
MDQFEHTNICNCLSQWPRGLRRGSAAARLLEQCVRISPGVWLSVCSECCVLSDRGLCVGLITLPGDSYRVWCVWVWSWILDNEEILAMVKEEIFKITVCGMWCRVDWRLDTNNSEKPTVSIFRVTLNMGLQIPIHLPNKAVGCNDWMWGLTKIGNLKIYVRNQCLPRSKHSPPRLQKPNT